MRTIVLCLILGHSFAHAQLGTHEKQGLKDTKEFLVNPGERQKFVDKDAKAKEVDKKVEALAGSGKNKEEIYGIAAEVMEKLANEAKGDPKIMQQILQDAQGNPEEFYKKYFDENAKARVRNVSSVIEKNGAVKLPPR